MTLMGLFNRKNQIPKILSLPILSNRKFIDKALTFISANNTTKSFEAISSHVFNEWKGQNLDQYLIGILLQLVDDGYVQETILGDFMLQVRQYTITGKGKKFCNAPKIIYKNAPYAYDNFIRGFEKIFTKFLPIIISLISLLISILAYLHTLNSKE
jgi:hypothetical protein